MHAVAEDDSWTALETKVISLFSWKYVTLFFCHSSSILVYLLPCLALKLQIHLGERLASLSYVCISPNTWGNQTKNVGVLLFFPVCCLSTNNTLIPPAGELHMLMSPASRDESCSAPALLAEGNLCMTAQPDVLHVNGCCRPEIWVQFTDVLFITMLKHNCIFSWRPELYAKGQFSLYKVTCSYLSNETANSVTVKAFSIRGNHWEW